jgi:DNA-directed RNA polymerase specialized sigma24 family protein
VAQTTWLRLVENLDRIREPDRLGAWLATTARRESLRVIRRGAREHATDEADLFEMPADESLDDLLLGRERGGALWRAFARLSDRCKGSCACSSPRRSRATRRSAARSACPSARSARPGSAVSSG